MMKILWKITVIILFIATSFAMGAETKTATVSVTPDILIYINKTWDNLTRNNNHLALYYDPKLKHTQNIIYISRQEDIHKIKTKLSKEFPKSEFQKIKINYLPENLSTLKQHGLLYLPFPYIIPGGRFNEMYGWDSYFIELGLLEDGRIGFAKNMVDNLLYEVNFYGTILNANRSYYLERSQPPLLTEMVLSLYEKTHDKKWLKSTLPTIKKLYQYWMSEPRYIPEIGLSRYYAGGEGPAPEESPNYYKKAARYYERNNVGDYDKNLYYDHKLKKLTPLFYKADRTVRESGFDITAKYGPYGASILDYAPVDLNVLLYKMEKQTAEIYKILGKKNQVTIWAHRANKRVTRINEYLWNASLGYYFDYNFKTHVQRPYVYATTFYPLWAGNASKQQAEQLVFNLPRLLAQGGIVSSLYTSQAQWDAPFGWAPFQYFTVIGLQNYGYHVLALDVAKRFVYTVDSGFKDTHAIFEKYDVEHGSTKTTDKITIGYNTNELGFGWTNGVYLMLLKYINSIKST